MSCRPCFEATRDEWAAERERRANRCDHDEQVCTYNDVPMCRPCFEQEKLDVDADRKARDQRRAECPACVEEARARYEWSQLHETIDPEQPWGQHIALTCKHHPELRWHTKNISHIGARSIFFSGWSEGLTECECPIGDLVVARG